MRLHRFFLEQSIGAEESGNKNLVLTHEPLLHQWKRVFRYKPGDKVLLFDNSGYEFEAEIEYLEPKEARLRIVEAKDKNGNKTKVAVHLCASLTKKDTFEWMLEKVTELGVTEVTPILS
jgi:16S rRNA (uracil1498-N3)-methyltransferase